MLESLNYSFRNQKNIIWVIYRIKQLRNYKKKENNEVLQGPQLGKQCWRARLGILRVKKKTVPHLVWEFPAFYAPWRFVTMFTTDRHLSLSYAWWTLFTHSHLISLFSQLSSHPHPCLKWFIFSFRVLHQNLLCISLLFHACYIPCPSIPLWSHLGGCNN